MKTIAAGSIKKGCLKFQALIFFGSLILTGCTVGPDYHPPRDQLPTHFINAKKKPSPEDVDAYWWRSIKDPVLASLINQALQRNLDIQQAQAKIRQSRAELNIATADFLPELNVTGKVSRDHLSRNSELISSIPFSIPLNYTDTKMEFDASWELDIFGHTRRTVEASKATLQSTIESMNDMALRVTAEVAKDYIQYRVYQQRINIATSTINSYKKTAKLIRLLLKAGNATAIDLQRTESQTLSAEATLPSLQAESRATLSALAVMIDESPESLYERLKQSAPIPFIRSGKVALGIPSELLKRRPDIRMAERELANATANIGVATANLYPRFQLVGDIGSETVINGTFTHAASRYWSFGPQISLPVFQGGRLRNAVKENEAARDAALATYKKSVLQALADVESALIRYQNEQIRERRLLSSYKKIKASIGLVNLQFKNGKAALTDVLDVERQAYDVQDQYVQSKGQVEVNRVSLYKALGGGIV